MAFSSFVPNNVTMLLIDYDYGISHYFDRNNCYIANLSYKKTMNWITNNDLII